MSENAVSTEIKWYEKPQVRAFVNLLSDGRLCNRNGDSKLMKRELIETVLAEINVDDTQGFIDIVKENIEPYLSRFAKERVDNAGRVFGCHGFHSSPTQFFVKNRRLIEDFVKPAGVQSKQDMINFIYDASSLYGLTDTTRSDFYNAFFEKDRVCNQGDYTTSDAWLMGCVAMNNIVLNHILDTYSVFGGLSACEPVKNTRQDKVVNTLYIFEHIGSPVKIDFVKAAACDDNAITDTRVEIGDGTLAVISSNKMNW